MSSRNRRNGGCGRRPIGYEDPRDRDALLAKQEERKALLDRAFNNIIGSQLSKLSKVKTIDRGDEEAYQNDLERKRDEKRNKKKKKNYVISKEHLDLANNTGLSAQTVALMAAKDRDGSEDNDDDERERSRKKRKKKRKKSSKHKKRKRRYYSSSSSSSDDDRSSDSDGSDIEGEKSNDDEEGGERKRKRRRKKKKRRRRERKSRKKKYQYSDDDDGSIVEGNSSSSSANADDAAAAAKVTNGESTVLVKGETSVEETGDATEEKNDCKIVPKEN